MKCRLTKFLSTSSLRCFLFALCCLLLCLGFGSSPANALYFYGEHGNARLTSGTATLSNSVTGGSTATFNSALYNGALRFTFPTTTTYPFIRNVCVSTSTGIPANSLVNFSVYINGISPGTDLVGVVGDNNLIVLEQDIEEYAEGSLINVTAVNLGGNNSYYCLGGSSGGFIAYIGSSKDPYVRVTSFSYARMLDGQQLISILNSIKSDLDTTGEDISVSRNHLYAILQILQNLGLDDISDSLNNQTAQLKEQTKLQEQQIAATNSAADQAHKDSQAQQEAINNQAKQEQDRYDQEKQEEQDRENAGKEDGNKLLGIFNITLLNPFAGIWEMFNSGGCASIPTIAGWIGSEDTTYCSWWPQSIRATLTPVFSLVSMMLLFGFAMRWLGSDSTGLDKTTNITEGFHGF